MPEIHGHSRRSDPNRPSHTYRAWQALKARCLRPTSPQYMRYRSLWYEPWRDFTVFLADMGERPQGMTLDRIDGSKPYGPVNCRWATPTQQARNRRTNKLTIELAREIHAAIGVDSLIAAFYGVSPTLVRKIRAETIWKESNR